MKRISVLAASVFLLVIACSTSEESASKCTIEGTYTMTATPETASPGCSAIQTNPGQSSTVTITKAPADGFDFTAGDRSKVFGSQEVANGVTKHASELRQLFALCLFHFAGLQPSPKDADIVVAQARFLGPLASALESATLLPFLQSCIDSLK